MTDRVGDSFTVVLTAVVLVEHLIAWLLSGGRALETAIKHGATLFQLALWTYSAAARP
jgi:hypothetical protein